MAGEAKCTAFQAEVQQFTERMVAKLNEQRNQLLQMLDIMLQWKTGEARFGHNFQEDLVEFPKSHLLKDGHSHTVASGLEVAAETYEQNSKGDGDVEQAQVDFNKVNSTSLLQVQVKNNEDGKYSNEPDETSLFCNNPPSKSGAKSVTSSESIHDFSSTSTNTILPFSKFIAEANTIPNYYKLAYTDITQGLLSANQVSLIDDIFQYQEKYKVNSLNVSWIFLVVCDVKTGMISNVHKLFKELPTLLDDPGVKVEGAYLIMLVNVTNLTEVHDPYGFRLLLMGKEMASIAWSFTTVADVCDSEDASKFMKEIVEQEVVKACDGRYNYFQFLQLVLKESLIAEHLDLSHFKSFDSRNDPRILVFGFNIHKGLDDDNGSSNIMIVITLEGFRIFLWEAKEVQSFATVLFVIGCYLKMCSIVELKLSRKHVNVIAIHVILMARRVLRNYSYADKFVEFYGERYKTRTVAIHALQQTVPVVVPITVLLFDGQEEEEPTFNLNLTTAVTAMLIQVMWATLSQELIAKIHGFNAEKDYLQQGVNDKDFIDDKVAGQRSLWSVNG